MKAAFDWFPQDCGFGILHLSVPPLKCWFHFIPLNLTYDIQLHDGVTKIQKKALDLSDFAWRSWYRLGTKKARVCEHDMLLHVGSVTASCHMGRSRLAPFWVMNQEQKPHSTVSTAHSSLLLWIMQAPLVLFLTKHVQASITVTGYLKARVQRFVKISRGPTGNNMEQQNRPVTSLCCHVCHASRATPRLKMSPLGYHACISQRGLPRSSSRCLHLLINSTRENVQDVWWCHMMSSDVFVFWCPVLSHSHLTDLDGKTLCHCYICLLLPGFRRDVSRPG